jgi:hypothetical protein
VLSRPSLCRRSSTVGCMPQLSAIGTCSPRELPEQGSPVPCRVPALGSGRSDLTLGSTPCFWSDATFREAGQVSVTRVSLRWLVGMARFDVSRGPRKNSYGQRTSQDESCGNRPRELELHARCRSTPQCAGFLDGLGYLIWPDHSLSACGELGSIRKLHLLSLRPGLISRTPVRLHEKRP